MPGLDPGIHRSRLLGKGEGEERYLSVAEVRTLFVEKRLPERITARLPKPASR